MFTQLPSQLLSIQPQSQFITMVNKIHIHFYTMSLLFLLAIIHLLLDIKNIAVSTSQRSYNNTSYSVLTLRYPSLSAPHQLLPSPLVQYDYSLQFSTSLCSSPTYLYFLYITNQLAIYACSEINGTLKTYPKVLKPVQSTAIMFDNTMSASNFQCQLMWSFTY